MTPDLPMRMRVRVDHVWGPLCYVRVTMSTEDAEKCGAGTII
jgi:hypothetical protein